MSSTAKTLLTADELEKLPDDDSVRIELDEGELIEMPPGGFRHSRIGIRIATRLSIFAEQNKLGCVCGPDSGYRLSDNTVRAPDVSFVRQERVVDTERYFPGTPDLAVEVLSPSDRIRQLRRKVRQYFDAGTHTVWIVYPNTREVEVRTAAGEERVLAMGDTIECPELLPGFSVKIDEFFD
jgi:Uma2 family endonuclease